MKIVKPSMKSAKLAKKILKAGGLVVVPSDTAYGLGTNACLPEAAKKIYDFKGRQSGKGISVFLNDTDKIKKYAVISKDNQKIIDTLLPGPFTLVLRSKGKTAPELEPEDKTIGIRVIDHPFINQLTKICLFPITATSANISGKGPHYSVDSFLKTLPQEKKKMINLVIDAGKLPKKPTSTVLRLIKDEIEILRQGILNPKLIKKILTKSETETKTTAGKIYHSCFEKNLKEKAVVVILQGDLGAGKTIFAKGIGEIFDKDFVSPTFVLMDEYPINKESVKNIYHLDLYRIETERELLELKLDQFLKPGNLMLIEWGEKLSILKSLKKENTVFYLIQIESKSNNQRIFNFYQI